MWISPTGKLFLLLLSLIASVFLLSTPTEASEVYSYYNYDIGKDFKCSDTYRDFCGTGMLRRMTENITGGMTIYFKMGKNSYWSNSCTIETKILNVNQTTNAVTSVNATSKNTWSTDDLDTLGSSASTTLLAFPFYFDDVTIASNTKYLFLVRLNETCDTSGSRSLWVFTDQGEPADTVPDNNQAIISTASTTVTVDNTKYLWTLIDNVDLSVIGNASLYFFYPQDGYQENCGINSTGNPNANWGLYYNLDEDDIGQWNIVMVFYTDSNNKSYNDWEIIGTSTDLTYWTTERSHVLPAGETSAWGLISRIDNCDNYYDEDCIWTDIASTSHIFFDISTASSCKDIMDYGLTGFTPASTTPESDENAGILGQVWSRFKNVFPLSIGFQLQEAFNDIKINGATTTQINIPLNTLVPEVMANQIATSVVAFSSESFNEAIPFWQSTFYKAMGYIIHLAFLIILIYILWPRTKQAVE